MTFLEILILIIVGAFAIRFSFKFDLNKFLENRRKVKLGQLKGLCPHTTANVNGEQIIIESLLSSPRGTRQWYCQQCGLDLNSEQQVRNIMELYEKDPTLILDRQKRFIKHAKKMKII